ncbi:MAG: VWA domain-containing protein [Flavobacteriales bacterium]|nr:VWA domain-containing protein [Flavobacteriales bacterium]
MLKFKALGKNRVVVLLCILSALMHSNRSIAQSPRKTRILFLLDASGSMYANMGSDNRMGVAKRLLSKMIDSLRYTPNLEIALRVYGHTSTKDKRNCKDTKLEVPFGARNHDKMLQELKALRPLGTTLIAYSLQEAAYDFPTDNNCRNIVVLITDGIEECDGDPCAISQALQKRGVILKPFIIGVGLDADFAKQFECVGRFFDATTEKGFDDVLRVVISQALNNTTLQVNLLDINGRALETDVNMTFYDSKTGRMLENFIHTFNDRGVPDTISLDPVNLYDIYVHTIPPVKKEKVEIFAGRHNIVAIDAPQGFLNLKVDGVTNYNRLQCIVKLPGSCEKANIQDFNTKEKYLVGEYEIEILSTPPIFEKVRISQSTITEVVIPQPGKLNFYTRLGVSGAIYKMENNRLNWVMNIGNATGAQIILLQPGNYKLICRANIEKRTLATKRIDFEIKSGAVTPLNVL